MSVCMFEFVCECVRVCVDNLSGVSMPSAMDTK